jgi:toxin ParE1/3/4
MMMSRCWVTASAKRDLDAIWYYVARETRSEEIATEFVDSIHRQFPLLGSSPKIGRQRDDFGTGIRVFPTGNYLIYYRSRGSKAHILRIIHGARDQKSAFFERPQ